MHGRLARAFQKELQKSLLTFRERLTHMRQTPPSWEIVQFKEYPRLKKISLPRDFSLSADLTQVITSRRTPSSFTKTELALSDLSNLLQYAAGITNRTNPELRYRNYPSGGSLYPLELYVVVQENSVQTIAPGVYHYNVKEHALETLGDTEMLMEVREALFSKQDAPLVIFISAVWGRTMQKYEDVGFKLALIEAGHVAQNILLVAQGLKLVGWPFINFNEQSMNKILDLDQRDEEDIIYALALGKS